MARMIPSQPDADAPRSERGVFEKFHDGLPDDWLVLHSRRFVLAGGRGSAIEDGEIDFLILDPARGLLALEVKGGAVQCEGGKWTSTEGGRVHRIKDPGKQAQRGIYTLDRWLGRQKALTSKLPERMRRIHFGFGVVLPRTIVRGDLGPDLPRKLILDSRDLADPEKSLDRVFEANGLAGPHLSPAAVDAFVDVVAPPLHLVHSLAAELDEERAALVRLTEDQIRVLTSLEKTKRVAIEGGAGTGKTVIAAEKARRLAAQGKRVLLLCFNRPLANHLASHAAGYDVNSFHGLCHDLAQQAKIKFPVPTDPKKQKHFWENEAPDILLEALAALPDERWDALIVDEGQDFRPHWWPVLEEALRDPGKGTLYVFHDPNQDLYGGGPPECLRALRYDLVTNCRNTARIARWCGKQIGVTPELKAGAPEGLAVEEIECANDKEMVEAVRRTLHRLLVTERVPSENVVVLSTRSPQRSCLAQHRKLGSATLVPPEERKKGGQVVFTSLQRFKGLEAEFVVLCDVVEGEGTSGPTPLYVGGSRARLGLALVSKRLTASI
jgi:hypothetical protein